MDAASTTESFLTEPDNLTELHKQSDLPFDHESRPKTNTGFLMQGDLLIHYLPTPPPKRERISWIWKR